MCGIIGFMGNVRRGQWGQTHDLLRALLLAAEHRGHDATGFVAQTDPMGRPLGAEVIVAKEPLRASEFVEFNAAFSQLRQRRCSAFIGHVRAATHGAAEDNRNNHPFTAMGCALVHNGIITNHVEITDKYALSLKTECDSEVLLRLVEAAGDPAAGLTTCLREVSGSMAVAMYDCRRQVVWLARNQGRPLWLARLRGDRRWFFASTDFIMLRAFRTVLGARAVERLDYFAPIPTDSVLALSADGSLIVPPSIPARGGSPVL